MEKNIEKSLENIKNELYRLRGGTEKGSEGMNIVSFVARCPFGAEVVLNKVKSIIEIIDSIVLKGITFESIVWESILPEWFIQAFSPPMNTDQADQWLKHWESLSTIERKNLEEVWTLENWLYWMEVSNRSWFWWDAIIIEEFDHIVLCVQVDSWPFPWGSLKWLFKISGASELSSEIEF